MSNKSRLSRLALQLEAQAETKKTADFGRRFHDAWKRGCVLCKDGKERTFDEWVKYLPDDKRVSIQKLMDLPR